MRRPPLRLVLFAAAAVLAAVAAAGPTERRVVDTVDVMLAVDVTGSMNARDYDDAGAPESRLAHLRRLLPAFVAGLTCGSRVGLSIFTERRSFVLFEPVEVCGAYPVIAAAIANLDWRMAWEGDSRVADGLYHALGLAAARGYDLVFLSDGQEAPPLPWSGGRPFEGEKGAVRGVVVGVGGTVPVPIPKFDDRGREAGFYAMEEIPQESRVGPPPPGAENRPGWHPRNNPFGDMPAGTEHLAVLREDHLVRLAGETGLAYARLGTPAELVAAVAAAAHPRPVEAVVDRAPLAGAAALVLAGLAVARLALAGVAAALRPTAAALRGPWRPPATRSPTVRPSAAVSAPPEVSS